MAKKQSEKQASIDAIIKTYLELKGTPYIEGNPAMGVIYRRHLRAAGDIYRASDGSVDVAIRKIREIKTWADSTGLSWSLETVTKRWFENNSPKPSNNYTNENWKDSLQERTPEQDIVIKKGVESIREILSRKGIKKE